MSVLKDHYYRLASDVPKERIDAATALVEELVSVNLADDWTYALNRLVNGLTTTRQAARFGFSMALTEVVRELIYKDDYELSIDTYLDKIIGASEVKASMKGKEERAALFGRLFGLQILLNSGLLFDTKVASNEVLARFCSVLIELSTTKSWLRETAIYTLCQFIGLYLQQEDYDEKIIISILQKINDSGLNLSTEGLAVYLAIPKALRSRLAAKVIGGNTNWKNGDPFSKGNLPTLAKTLKDAEISNPNDDEDESKKKSKQKGSWVPRVPFVWDSVIHNFSHELPEQETIKKDKKRSKAHKSGSKKLKTEHGSKNESDISLKEFWKVVVDETLFSDKASHERKFWGFEIFIKFLHSIGPDEISYLFTPNILRCLINQSSQANRLLNKISIKVLNSITEVCKKDIRKAPVILERLIDESVGGWNFDLMTKSKVTDSLVGVLANVEETDANAEAVAVAITSVLLSFFTEAVDTQKGDDDGFKKSNDNAEKWALDKLLVLFKSSKKFSSWSNDWLDDIFKFLVKAAFFSPTEGNSVSGNIRKLAQDRLNTFLSETMSTTRKGSSYASYCIKQIEKLEQSKLYKINLELDEELTSVKQECSDLLVSIKELSSIKSTKKSVKDQLGCFELLFSMVLIQLYMGDDETVTVLGELKTCYENTFAGSEEDVDPSIVLTEVILSFISRKSALLKKLSLIVWETFLCSKNEDGTVKLTPECLQLLFEVLETKENKEGQQKLFDADAEFEAEEDEKDGEDEEEEEEDEDEDEDDEEDDSNSDSDSDSESDSANTTSQVDKDTTIKLAQALGIPTESSGEVKFEDIDDFGDDNNDSYESDSMDDEQMMAMDDQLSKIFKDRRDALTSISSGSKRKAEVLEARERMIFFKNKILDLLDSFSKLNPNSYINFSIIKPIIILIDLTMDKNLGVKAHKLLKTRLSKTKITSAELERNFPSKQAQDEFKQSLLGLIQWAQDRAATKSSIQAHGLACSQSCILVAKNLVELDSQYLEQVVDVYSKSLKDWALDPKNKLQASLFFDFINWVNSKRAKKTAS